jgi:flagellin-like protein
MPVGERAPLEASERPAGWTRDSRDGQSGIGGAVVVIGLVIAGVVEDSSVI